MDFSLTPIVLLTRCRLPVNRVPSAIPSTAGFPVQMESNPDQPLTSSNNNETVAKQSMQRDLNHTASKARKCRRKKSRTGPTPRLDLNIEAVLEKPLLVIDALAPSLTSCDDLISDDTTRDYALGQDTKADNDDGGGGDDDKPPLLKPADDDSTDIDESYSPNNPPVFGFKEAIAVSVKPAADVLNVMNGLGLSKVELLSSLSSGADGVCGTEDRLPVESEPSGLEDSNRKDLQDVVLKNASSKNATFEKIVSEGSSIKHVPYKNLSDGDAISVDYGNKTCKNFVFEDSPSEDIADKDVTSKKSGDKKSSSETISRASTPSAVACKNVSRKTTSRMNTSVEENSALKDRSRRVKNNSFDVGPAERFLETPASSDRAQVVGLTTDCLPTNQNEASLSGSSTCVMSDAPDVENGSSSKPVGSSEDSSPVVLKESFERNQSCSGTQNDRYSVCMKASSVEEVCSVGGTTEVIQISIQEDLTAGDAQMSCLTQCLSLMEHTSLDDLNEVSSKSDQTLTQTELMGMIVAPDDYLADVAPPARVQEENDEYQVTSTSDEPIVNSLENCENEQLESAADDDTFPTEKNPQDFVQGDAELQPEGVYEPIEGSREPAEGQYEQVGGEYEAVEGVYVSPGGEGGYELVYITSDMVVPEGTVFNAVWPFAAQFVGSEAEHGLYAGVEPTLEFAADDPLAPGLDPQESQLHAPAMDAQNLTLVAYSNAIFDEPTYVIGDSTYIANDPTYIEGHAGAELEPREVLGLAPSGLLGPQNLDGGFGLLRTDSFSDAETALVQDDPFVASCDASFVSTNEPFDAAAYARPRNDVMLVAAATSDPLLEGDEEVVGEEGQGAEEGEDGGMGVEMREEDFVLDGSEWVCEEGWDLVDETLSADQAAPGFHDNVSPSASTGSATEEFVRSAIESFQSRQIRRSSRLQKDSSPDVPPSSGDTGDCDDPTDPLSMDDASCDSTAPPCSVGGKALALLQRLDRKSSSGSKGTTLSGSKKSIKKLILRRIPSDDKTPATEKDSGEKNKPLEKLVIRRLSPDKMRAIKEVSAGESANYLEKLVVKKKSHDEMQAINKDPAGPKPIQKLVFKKRSSDEIASGDSAKRKFSLGDSESSETSEDYRMEGERKPEGQSLRDRSGKPRSDEQLNRESLREAETNRSAERRTEERIAGMKRLRDHSTGSESEEKRKKLKPIGSAADARPTVVNSTSNNRKKFEAHRIAAGDVSLRKPVGKDGALPLAASAVKPRDPVGSGPRAPAGLRCRATGCVKAPRDKDSIYCSEACVGAHCAESLRLIDAERRSNYKQAPGASSSNIAMAMDAPLTSSSSSERMVVFERRTGKIVTGPLAPTEGTLLPWLLRHPTFEVVQPTTGQASLATNKRSASSNRPGFSAAGGLGSHGSTTTAVRPTSRPDAWGGRGERREPRGLSPGAARAAGGAEKSSQKPSMSRVLDTTSQHGRHVFDINCRLCSRGPRTNTTQPPGTVASSSNSPGTDRNPSSQTGPENTSSQSRIQFAKKSTSSDFTANESQEKSKLLMEKVKSEKAKSMASNVDKKRGSEAVVSKDLARNMAGRTGGSDTTLSAEKLKSEALKIGRLQTCSSVEKSKSVTVDINRREVGPSGEKSKHGALKMMQSKTERTSEEKYMGKVSKSGSMEAKSAETAAKNIVKKLSWTEAMSSADMVSGAATKIGSLKSVASCAEKSTDDFGNANESDPVLFSFGRINRVAHSMSQKRDENDQPAFNWTPLGSKSSANQGADSSSNEKAESEMLSDKPKMLEAKDVPQPIRESSDTVAANRKTDEVRPIKHKIEDILKANRKLDETAQVLKEKIESGVIANKTGDEVWPIRNKTSDRSTSNRLLDKPLQPIGERHCEVLPNRKADEICQNQTKCDPRLLTSQKLGNRSAEKPALYSQLISGKKSIEAKNEFSTDDPVIDQSQKDFKNGLNNDSVPEFKPRLEDLIPAKTVRFKEKLNVGSQDPSSSNSRLPIDVLDPRLKKSDIGILNCRISGLKSDPNEAVALCGSPTVDKGLSDIDSPYVRPKEAVRAVGGEGMALADMVWEGSIAAQDLPSFSATAYRTSGSMQQLRAVLPETIAVMGRINPATVEEYLTRIQQLYSATKEIAVVCFRRASGAGEDLYDLLFDYLQVRRRCGVIGSIGTTIKDMYIWPLPASSPVPPVLLPFRGPGLEVKREVNLLLGVAVQQATRKLSLIDLPKGHRAAKTSHHHHRSPGGHHHGSRSDVQCRAAVQMDVGLRNPHSSTDRQGAEEEEEEVDSEDPIVCKYARVSDADVAAGESSGIVDPVPAVAPVSGAEEDTPYDPVEDEEGMTGVSGSQGQAGVDGAQDRGQILELSASCVADDPDIPPPLPPLPPPVDDQPPNPPPPPPPPPENPTSEVNNLSSMTTRFLANLRLNSASSLDEIPLPPDFNNIPLPSTNHFLPPLAMPPAITRKCKALCSGEVGVMRPGVQLPSLVSNVSMQSTTAGSGSDTPAQKSVESVATSWYYSPVRGLVEDISRNAERNLLPEVDTTSVSSVAPVSSDDTGKKTMQFENFVGDSVKSGNSLFERAGSVAASTAASSITSLPSSNTASSLLPSTAKFHSNVPASSQNVADIFAELSPPEGSGAGAPPMPPLGEAATRRLLEAFSASCRAEAPDRQMALLEQLLEIIERRNAPASSAPPEGKNSPRGSKEGGRYGEGSRVTLGGGSVSELREQDRMNPELNHTEVKGCRSDDLGQGGAMECRAMQPEVAAGNMLPLCQSQATPSRLNPNAEIEQRAIDESVAQTQMTSGSTRSIFDAILEQSPTKLSGSSRWSATLDPRAKSASACFSIPGILDSSAGRQVTEKPEIVAAIEKSTFSDSAVNVKGTIANERVHSVQREALCAVKVGCTDNFSYDQVTRDQKAAYAENSTWPATKCSTRLPYHPRQNQTSQAAGHKLIEQFSASQIRAIADDVFRRGECFEQLRTTLEAMRCEGSLPGSLSGTVAGSLSGIVTGSLSASTSGGVDPPKCDYISDDEPSGVLFDGYSHISKEDSSQQRIQSYSTFNQVHSMPSQITNPESKFNFPEDHANAAATEFSSYRDDTTSIKRSWQGFQRSSVVDRFDSYQFMTDERQFDSSVEAWGSHERPQGFQVESAWEKQAPTAMISSECSVRSQSNPHNPHSSAFNHQSTFNDRRSYSSPRQNQSEGRRLFSDSLSSIYDANLASIYEPHLDSYNTLPNRASQNATVLLKQHEYLLKNSGATVRVGMTRTPPSYLPGARILNPALDDYVRNPEVMNQKSEKYSVVLDEPEPWESADYAEAEQAFGKLPGTGNGSDMEFNCGANAIMTQGPDESSGSGSRDVNGAGSLGSIRFRLDDDITLNPVRDVGKLLERIKDLKSRQNLLSEEKELISSKDEKSEMQTVIDLSSERVKNAESRDRLAISNLGTAVSAGEKLLDDDGQIVGRSKVEFKISPKLKARFKVNGSASVKQHNYAEVASSHDSDTESVVILDSPPPPAKSAVNCISEGKNAALLSAKLQHKRETGEPDRESRKRKRSHAEKREPRDAKRSCTNTAQDKKAARSSGSRDDVECDAPRRDSSRESGVDSGFHRNVFERLECHSSVSDHRYEGRGVGGGVKGRGLEGGVKGHEHGSNDRDSSDRRGGKSQTWQGSRDCNHSSGGGLKRKSPLASEGSDKSKRRDSSDSKSDRRHHRRSGDRRYLDLDAPKDEAPERKRNSDVRSPGAEIPKQNFEDGSRSSKHSRDRVSSCGSGTSGSGSGAGGSGNIAAEDARKTSHSEHRERTKDKRKGKGTDGKAKGEMEGETGRRREAGEGQADGGMEAEGLGGEEEERKRRRLPAVTMRLLKFLNT